MRAILIWSIVALLAGPASADDCAPAAEAFFATRIMTENLLGLTRARLVDWDSIAVDAQNRPALTVMQTATNALLDPLQLYASSAQAALPFVASCTLLGERLSTQQLSIIEDARLAAEALAPLLVEYLVAYDGLPPPLGR